MECLILKIAAILILLIYFVVSALTSVVLYQQDKELLAALKFGFTWYFSVLWSVISGTANIISGNEGD